MSQTALKRGVMSFVASLVIALLTNFALDHVQYDFGWGGLAFAAFLSLLLVSLFFAITSAATIIAELLSRLQFWLRRQQQMPTQRITYLH